MDTRVKINGLHRFSQDTPDIRTLFQNVPFDCYISTNDSQDLIPAHKIVLASFSPFLRAILNDRSEQGDAKIFIESIEYNTIKSLLFLIYFGKITNWPFKYQISKGITT